MDSRDRRVNSRRTRSWLRTPQTPQTVLWLFLWRFWLSSSFMSPEMACLFPSPPSAVLYVSLHPRRLSRFMADVLFVHVAVASWVMNVRVFKCSSFLHVLPLLSAASALWRFMWRDGAADVLSPLDLTYICHLAYERLAVNPSVLLMRKTALQTNPYEQSEI